MNPSDADSIGLTLQLATVTTVALLAWGTPLAWWLGRGRSRLRRWVSATVTLPLVLPPTVLGFYLLLFLGPHGWGGRLTQALGLGPLPFTFWGLVLASVVSSLPFVVHPLASAFRALGAAPLEAAATLRVGPLRAFFTVALPLTRSSFVTAALLGFAHTLGEFGVVLMLGGNIPGETRVISIALFEHVEALQYGRAHLLALVLVVGSLLVLLALGPLHERPARS